jgi:DNA-directed RNA polymerase subunit delta
MANNILKEAIADAKAVREVALANAKAALEEAFTPKLQSMLSAKLSEELEEDYYDEDESNMDETYYDEDESDVDEMHGDMHYDEDESDMDETYYDEDEGEEDSMDEEIDLEEILNELELEGSDETEEETEELEEVHTVNPKASDIQRVDYGTQVNESKDFDLDSLLKEINDLDDDGDLDEDLDLSIEDDELTEMAMYGDPDMDDDMFDEDIDDMDEMDMDFEMEDDMMMETNRGCGCKKENIQLQETRKAYNHVKTELNEVNLLNSKLLYVNRIFKANDLSEVQKLNVVETLDKAESTKEAKLIYETVKDTFTISKKKKTNPKRSIRENFGMASKSSGTTQSSTRKNSIISESNDMVARFKKLANIKIK